MVDRNALRTNQSFIIGLLVLGFILGVSNGGAWLILGVGVVLASGTLDRRLALFQQVYRQGLRRAGLKGERVDFIPALKIAMDQPDVLRRWLGGESFTDPESDALNVDPAPSDHPTPDPL